MPSHRPLIPQIMQVLAALLLPAIAGTAAASVPQSVVVEGVLLSAGGGPAADGTYKIVFSLYKDAVGGSALWTETDTNIAVKGGQFTCQIGAVTPLTPATLANLPAVYLGLAVETDPELPRKAMSSMPFSLRAALAEGLDCTGCVTLSHLEAGLLQPYAKSANLAKIATTGAYADLSGAPALAKVAASGQYADLAGIPDLSGFAKAGNLAKVATSGAYTDLTGVPDLAAYAKSATLANVAVTGKFGDLTGAPPLGSACGTNLFVRGFKTDGGYDCAAAFDVSMLPADALAKVSNGQLTVQIPDFQASSTVPVAIADNSPKGSTDSLVWPDYGTAQGITVTVDLTNSNVANIKLLLTAPDLSVITLYDKSASGATLKTTFTDKSTLPSGSLAAWLNKNPVGTWTLTVIDSDFKDNKTDGQLNAWSMAVQTLSGKKVKALGGFQFLNANSHPVTCDASQFGFTYANPKDLALYVCNGKVFYPIALTPLGTLANPALSCKDMLTKAPGSKDGYYWVTSGGATFQAYCDMTNNGGGWTLAARMMSGSWCQIGADAVGTLTSPTQSSCAKLSDASVKGLYTDQFWLSCGTNSPERFGKIDNIVNWNTTASTGDKKMTWSMTYGGATYSGTDDPCCNFGDHSYHNPHIIYSIAPGYNSGNYKAGWDGCYNNQDAGGWSRPGYLYVR